MGKKKPPPPPPKKKKTHTPRSVSIIHKRKSSSYWECSIQSSCSPDPDPPWVIWLSSCIYSCIAKLSFLWSPQANSPPLKKIHSLEHQLSSAPLLTYWLTYWPIHNGVQWTQTFPGHSTSDFWSLHSSVVPIRRVMTDFILWVNTRNCISQN